MNGSIVDVNVHLGRWPFRRLELDDTSRLVSKMRSCGIREAWVGSYDAILAKDIAAVNDRLVRETRRNWDVRLLPFGAVNLSLPDWQEDVRRCAQEHKMPGIRLYPGYHSYTIADPQFVELMGLAAQHQLIVGIVARLEDERTTHPLLRIPVVDLAPLAAISAQFPTVRLLLLNALTASQTHVFSLLRSGRVWSDMATLEGVGTFDRVSDPGLLSKIVFGSHAPYYYLESSLLKLKETSLEQVVLHRIRVTNAQELLSI